MKMNMLVKILTMVFTLFVLTGFAMSSVSAGTYKIGADTGRLVGNWKIVDNSDHGKIIASGDFDSVYRTDSGDIPDSCKLHELSFQIHWAGYIVWGGGYGNNFEAITRAYNGGNVTVKSDLKWHRTYPVGYRSAIYGNLTNKQGYYEMTKNDAKWDDTVFVFEDQVWHANT